MMLWPGPFIKVKNIVVGLFLRMSALLLMMNLRVLEHDCLTIIIMPISLFMFKSLTLALLHIPVYLMMCCLMGTYIHWVLMFVWVQLFRKG